MELRERARSSAAGLLAAGLCFFVAMPAAATSAPPPPAEAIRASEAIRDLEPFLGGWEGEEIHPSGSVRVYRQVIRPPLADQLLFVSYRNGSFDRLNVLTWVSQQGYRLLLPGYSGAEPPNASLAFERIDPMTLRWETRPWSWDPTITRRTTVTLRGDEWRERIELFGADGKVFSDVTAILKRTGEERWHVPPWEMPTIPRR